MKNYQKIISKVMIGLISILSVPSWGAGVGSDNNPSSISATFKAFYAPVPKLVANKSPYGGLVCQLSSANNGFQSASGKWRNPNIVGTVNIEGHTYEIQRTNISGIGVIARMGAQFYGQPYALANTVITSNYQTLTQSTDEGSGEVVLGRKFWGLVTIPGEPLIPGKYDLGQSETMIDIWCHAKDVNNDTHGGAYLTGTVEINSPTCYLGPDVSSIINMDLGQHSWSHIRNLNIGNNFGSATRNLSVSCESGSWPKVTITDKNNASNSSNIISLTNPGASTTAQGIGVQVFLNHQSIAQQLTKVFNLAPSKLMQDKTIDLPIEFKYIKTAEKISTGEANAIVDLTFTYD